MLSKNCQSCGNVFYKKQTESVSYWERKKLCSKVCANKYKIGISFSNSGQFRKGDKRLIGNKNAFGNIPWNKDLKGIRLSEKSEFKKGHKGFRRIYFKGKDNPKWNSIEKECIVCKNKYFVQKYRAEKSRFCSSHCYHKWHIGKNSPVWTDNYKKRFKIRIMELPEYKQWRLEVFKRDKFTCQNCKTIRKEIEAHHINSFYNIIKKNNIIDTEMARNCKELWDVKNGKTLCKKHHRETDNYGIRTIKSK